MNRTKNNGSAKKLKSRLRNLLKKIWPPILNKKSVVNLRAEITLIFIQEIFLKKLFESPSNLPTKFVYIFSEKNKP